MPATSKSIQVLFKSYQKKPTAVRELVNTMLCQKATVALDRHKKNVAHGMFSEASEFKVGDKVEVNGNKEGQIVKVHDGKLNGMYDVRLWDGSRKVGEVTVSGKEIKKLSESAQSGDDEEYEKFFRAALKKFGVSEPDELKGDKEKEFYDYIDKNWKGDHEKVDEANYAWGGIEYKNALDHKKSGGQKAAVYGQGGLMHVVYVEPNEKVSDALKRWKVQPTGNVVVKNIDDLIADIKSKLSASAIKYAEE